MPYECSGKTMDAVLSYMAGSIMKKGRDIAPRGTNVREAYGPATFELQNPLTGCFVQHPERKLPYQFIMAENIWYLSGSMDSQFVTRYVKRMNTYNEGGLLLGAYGPKILSQLNYIIETIGSDEDTRQAVISLWERNPRTSKDIPCTSLMVFQVRDGRLDLHVTMRSNDLVLGTTIDVPSFCMLQGLVAWALHYPVGSYYHTATSLHIYETNFEQANKLVQPFNVEDEGVKIYNPWYFQGAWDGCEPVERLKQAMTDFKLLYSIVDRGLALGVDRQIIAEEVKVLINLEAVKRIGISALLGVEAGGLTGAQDKWSTVV